MTVRIASSCWGAVRSRSRSWSNRCSCSSSRFRAVSVRLRISCSIRSRSGGASGSASSSRCRSEKAALSSTEAWAIASRYAATSASPHCAAANSTSLVASLSASSVASSARFASRLSWSTWAAAALALGAPIPGRPPDEEDAAAEQEDHERRGEVDPRAVVARLAPRRYGRRLACWRGGGRRRDRLRDGCVRERVAAIDDGRDEVPALQVGLHRVDEDRVDLVHRSRRRATDPPTVRPTGRRPRPAAGRRCRRESSSQRWRRRSR